MALTPLVRLVDAAAVRGSHRVVALTDDFRRYLLRVGLKRPGEVGVIADAYDAAVYRPGDRAEARAALGLPPEAFVAVYSGFTYAYRRVETLVEAWAAVRQAHPSAILCLVGGRPGK